jgi:hypothetical protein
MSGLPRLCWFVIGLSMLERLKPNAVMLTHGVASSRTLALLGWLCLQPAAPRHLFKGMALYPRCRVLPTAVRRAQVLVLADCLTRGVCKGSE